VHFARSVRREHDQRRRGGPDCAQLGNCDLELSQQFEQVAFELFVSPIDLVDQQDGRSLAAGIDRL
jgi:hypothetical protein